MPRDGADDETHSSQKDERHAGFSLAGTDGTTGHGWTLSNQSYPHAPKCGAGSSCERSSPCGLAALPTPCVVNSRGWRAPLRVVRSRSRGVAAIAEHAAHCDNYSGVREGSSASTEL